MKIADYIVDYITFLGTKCVFMVTGGAIAHVTDAVGRRAKEKGDIDYVCVQHEQAGAMAIESYSRFGSEIGVMLVTSGPGATNLITGICGCWFDSIPTLFISGQVSTAESGDVIKTKPRQVGFQETDIISIVKPITKFAEKITDPNKIKYYLDKAIYLAKSGRPGPVLLDLPVDIQVAEINPSKLVGFSSNKETKEILDIDSDEVIGKKTEEIINLIKKARRPIILLGSGVRLGNAEKQTMKLIEFLNWPVVVSWGAFDILPYNQSLLVGAFGVYGSRGANFAVQNSDLIISLGSRLDTRQTGGRVNYFARQAKKVMVDIDKNEILKGRGLLIDIGVIADIKNFLNIFNAKIKEITKPNISSWVKRAKEWKIKYPAVLPEYFKQKDKINVYAFLKILSDEVGSKENIIFDEGGNLIWAMQSWEVKDGQRIISTFGNSPMGYALPASIGASMVQNKKPIICIDGDGGFQLNIQELQTVFYYQLPIKIFILNNKSMGIIKQFQDQYFGSRYFATSLNGGYSSPDFVKVARAYGIKAVAIKTFDEIKDKIKEVLNYDGPILCDVWIDKDQKIKPKIEFGRPLEDMSPYLERKEFLENMIIEPLPESKQMPKSTGWQVLK
ncbi:thiamine pyrophosphate-binding protein [Candidatus Wolfebacteria bacterium]|nr:thiamine pyrophosphate-binding protein [Candidatus Wolfebacteria bacterium]